MAAGDDLQTTGRDSSGAGLSAGLVVGIVLGIALALFVLQNTETTTVTFLAFDFEQPLWVVLLVTVAFSFTISALLGGFRRRRKR